MKDATLLLDEAAIAQKIKRLSYQIYEDNFDEKEIVFIGIKDNGVLFAEKILNYFNEISTIKAYLFSIQLNKLNPNADSIIFEGNAQLLQNKVVILIDDVANSGKTMCYALKPILEYLPKKIQTLVLIDRKHKNYPIQADYIGLSLSTTMKEHIRVELKPKEINAYLV